MLVKGLDGLLSGDRKLALLRAAEVVLELREHVTHSRLRGINREAAFARACDVELRAERQYRAVRERTTAAGRSTRRGCARARKPYFNTPRAVLAVGRGGSHYPGLRVGSSTRMEDVMHRISMARPWRGRDSSLHAQADSVCLRCGRLRFVTLNVC